MEPKKLAIGYCRVSKEDQAENGVSIETQDAAIRHWCLMHGYTLVKVYHEVQSGKNVDARPRFQTCITYTCQLRAALVTYDLSRSARSLPDALDMAEHLHRKGANFVSLKEGVIDTTTPYGELIFRIMATINDFQRKQTVEKTKASLDHLKRTGKKYCHHAPYGYSFEGDDLVENPRELRVMDLIRVLLRTRGFKALRICGILNRRGIKRRNGKEWTKIAVEEKISRIEQGEDKRPGAAKRPKLRPLPVELDMDYPNGKPQYPPKCHVKNDRPIKPKKKQKVKRTQEEYREWLSLVSHPCLLFESPELTPEGFRNLTDEEMKYSRRKKFSRNKARRPVLRTPAEAILAEGFEEMDEATTALVQRLLGADIPVNAPEEFDERFADEEVEDLAEPVKNNSLPWHL
jgi:site-specific DNA recombinase